MRTSLAERDAKLAMLYINGHTMEEVAAVFGCTRENVRLRLKAAGVDHRHYGVSADPLLIIAAVRKVDTLSVTAIATMTGSTGADVRQVLAALGLTAAVYRLFRWRHDRLLVDRFTQLAQDLGRNVAV